jgi:hypothetical protein
MAGSRQRMFSSVKVGLRAKGVIVTLFGELTKCHKGSRTVSEVWDGPSNE